MARIGCQQIRASIFVGAADILTQPNQDTDKLQKAEIAINQFIKLRKDSPDFTQNLFVYLVYDLQGRRMVDYGLKSWTERFL